MIRLLNVGIYVLKVYLERERGLGRERERDKEGERKRGVSLI